MRKSWHILLGALAAGLVIWSMPVIKAGEKKTGPLLKIKGKLTEDDPRDKDFPNSYFKVHTLKMEAGKSYVITLVSKDFDAFLRLEDPKGKKVAFDDDSAGNLNSKIVYKADQEGNYRIIATSLDSKLRPSVTGIYTLTVDLAGPLDALATRVKSMGRLSGEDRLQLLADLQKYLAGKKETLTPSDSQIAFMAAIKIEQLDRARAIETYSQFSKILTASKDPKVNESRRTMEGAIRRLKLPGKEMVLKGTSVDGKAVDLKSYRGKVVLVDFWATWCGPCLVELPNVKKMYEKYHDKGFEVVAISLDFKEAALTKFLENKKLPWVCLYDRTPGNNLSEYYGILFIPLPILVDRDGRVVSMAARGLELENLLEKYLEKK